MSARYKVTHRKTGTVHYLTGDQLAKLSHKPDDDGEKAFYEGSAPLPPARRASASNSRHSFAPIPADIDRNTAIKLIRQALAKRSGKSWSVTGGSGTAWGWIRIDAPPARRIYDSEGAGPGHYTGPADRAELGKLLGLDGPVHHQGESVAADSHYRREYIERARGQKPTVIGTPYWD